MATDQQRRRAAEMLGGLRTQVLAMRHGERLPSERALAQEWGVARMTVRQAIATLSREGLVRTVQGSGSTRAPGPVALTVGLGSFAESVAAHGMQPTTTLLDLGLDAHPPPEAAEFLGLDDRHRAVRVRRLRCGDDVPLALESAWLPLGLVRDLTADLAAAGLRRYLVDRSLLPDSGEESVRGDFPDRHEAHRLQMPTGSPVLRLVRRGCLGDRPLEYSTTVFPADRYVLSRTWDLRPPAPGAG